MKQVRIRAMENGVGVRCSWEKRQGGGRVREDRLQEFEEFLDFETKWLTYYKVESGNGNRA